jgi:muramoyltetrapeptide carboxypeptidase LdcA involved in peptidoglycan recycling
MAQWNLTVKFGQHSFVEWGKLNSLSFCHFVIFWQWLSSFIWYFLIIYCFCDFSSGYLAGSDKERAADVMTMWKDPTIKMIIANRGGYGCARILDLVTLLLFLSCDSSKSSADVWRIQLDYDFIRSHPKPIMGYSDLTALLNAIHFKTGLVTFHGPMGIEDWTNLNGVFFQNVLMNGNIF